jgi:hypothetical protein
MPRICRIRRVPFRSILSVFNSFLGSNEKFLLFFLQVLSAAESEPASSGPDAVSLWLVVFKVFKLQLSNPHVGLTPAAMKMGAGRGRLESRSSGKTVDPCGGSTPLVKLVRPAL